MIIDYFIFFRAKRRERDNARKAQSRRWYYEKADWIVSDEIEDDELDLSEEEVILEQSLEVPTVKVDRVLTFKSNSKAKLLVAQYCLLPRYLPMKY